MSSSVLAAAGAFNNLRKLDPSNPLASTRKTQIQFDGMSWTRGHGCTRLIDVRTPDLLQQFNSLLYFRDVVFYIGSDKCKDLAANFQVGGEASIRNVLFDSMTLLADRQVRLLPVLLASEERLVRVLQVQESCATQPGGGDMLSSPQSLHALQRQGAAFAFFAANLPGCIVRRRADGGIHCQGGAGDGGHDCPDASHPHARPSTTTLREGKAHGAERVV
eukprot:826493-Pleurochrysis_carterae.AAC.1